MNQSEIDRILDQTVWQRTSHSGRSGAPILFTFATRKTGVPYYTLRLSDDAMRAFGLRCGDRVDAGEAPGYLVIRRSGGGQYKLSAAGGGADRKGAEGQTVASKIQCKGKPEGINDRYEIADVIHSGSAILIPRMDSNAVCDQQK